MEIPLRIAAGVAGAAIIGTLVNVAVAANGGYGGPAAPLLIAVGAGVVIGAAVIGRCWSQGHRLMAILLAGALFSGEAYQLLMTAERTVATRDARQAPLIEQAKARDRAVQSVQEAEARLAAVGASPRLERAVAAKSAADSAVLQKAADRGCVSNCRALLEQQVLTAKRELDDAHQEIAAMRSAATEDLDGARTILAAIPAPGSATPLADRLGIESWKLDLIAASLLSLGANGLGAVLVAFAAHTRKPDAPIIDAVVTAVEMEKPIAPRRNAKHEADRFAKDVFVPEPNGAVELGEVHRAYLAWCKRNGLDPLSERTIAAALVKLFSEVNLIIDGDRLVGISWRPAISST